MHSHNDLFQGCFSAGPTRKHKGWTVKNLQHALVGRSHRSESARVRLKELIDETRTLLNIPEDFHLAIVPGSATGAVEIALWNMLMPSTPVTCHEVDVFSGLWAYDLTHELKLNPRIQKPKTWGELPDLKYDPTHDYVLTLNASTSGTYYKDLNWIPTDRQNLVIADATSSVFAIPVDFKKIDAFCFSWQKGLGGEAGHGMIALSPRAMERLDSHTPPWPIPRLFSLKRGGEINFPLFEGFTTNTPSMLCVEDALQGIRWAEKMGGIEVMYMRTQHNINTLITWVESCPHLRFSSRAPSPTTPCVIVKPFEHLSVEDHFAVLRSILKKMEHAGLAFDIVNHAFAFPAFRLWCGPTVEAADIEALLPPLIKEIEERIS